MKKNLVLDDPMDGHAVVAAVVVDNLVVVDRLEIAVVYVAFVAVAVAVVVVVDPKFDADFDDFEKVDENYYYYNYY